MDVCGANTRCATLEGGESGALENRVKLGCSQATTGLKLGRVKDPETPGGGVFQPFIEASRAPVLRVKLVRAG